MPAIIPKYAPNDKTTNELGNIERKERNGLYDAAQKYYDDGGARKPLKVRPGQPDDNIMLNMSGDSVDKSVAFCAPKPPKFIMPGGMDRKPGPDGKLTNVVSPEQEAVDRFLESNEFDYQIVDILLSGFICGHNFIRLFMPDNTAPMNADNPPRMALLDPRKIIKFWDVSDIRRTLFYRLMWAVSDDVFRRQDIVPTWLERQSQGIQQKPDLALGWEIIEYEGKGENGEYKEITRDHWDYPFAPVIDWKNKHAPHQAYGESDLKGADLNDAINFIASNTARIIKFYAHPRTIGTGVEVTNLKSTSIDGFWTIPENSKIENLEMQSDLSSSLTFLDKLQGQFFTQMHVVDIANIKDKLGGLTNFAVRVMFKDMLDTADMKHSLYGNGLAETVRRACVMMGYANAVRPEDKWEDPLPENRMEVVQSLEKEKALGAVSTQTIQEDLHRDPAVEGERMAEEQSNSGDSFANVLAKINQRGFAPSTFGGGAARLPQIN